MMIGYDRPEGPPTDNGEFAGYCRTVSDVEAATDYKTTVTVSTADLNSWYQPTTLPYVFDLRIKNTDEIVTVTEEIPSWFARLFVRLIGLEWHRRTEEENFIAPAHGLVWTNMLNGEELPETLVYSSNR